MIARWQPIRIASRTRREKEEVSRTRDYKILIMGASYGSLLAARLLFARHALKLVCLPAEAALINKEGIRVRLPIKGRDGLVEIDSRLVVHCKAGAMHEKIPE
jgi:hypothetical protein